MSRVENEQPDDAADEATFAPDATAAVPEAFLNVPLGPIRGRHVPRTAPARPASPPCLSLLRPGEQVDGFVIDRFLARGGLGEVYVASQLATGREVALKVVPDGSGCERTRARFAREAASAARIEAKGVATVYCAGADAARGVLWLAMRLVRGVSFADALEEQARAAVVPDAVARREIVARVQEVAVALQRVHAAGIVHCDVKPSNIVVAGGTLEAPWRGQAVLVDFGLARPRSQRHVTSHWGTRAYAAPEILAPLQQDAHDPRIDDRADVFSLGVTLYDLLRGKGPESRVAAAHGPLPPLRKSVPACDADLAAIVAKATDLDPGRRYHDCASFADDLQAWLAGEPVRARRRGMVARLFSHRRLRRSVLGAAGLAVVALAVVALAAAGLVSLWRVGAAEDAFARGDLAMALAQGRGVPPALLARCCSAGLVSLCGARGGEPLGEVGLRLSRHEPGAALLRAGAWLCRDGYAAHPVLVRFLAAGLHAEQRPRAAATVARLVLERPVPPPHLAPELAAAEAAACAPLRDALLAMLAESGRTPAELAARHSAISALGGCGQLAHGEGLLAAASRQDAESLRLALHAASELVRREARLDGGAACALACLALGECGAGPTRAESCNLLAGLTSLRHAVAFALRAAGLPMPELATLPGPAGSGSAIAWRAALGRREAWTEAAQRPLEPGAGALAAATRCAELGWIAGCLAPEVPRDSVRAALARTGLAEEDAATLFAAAERQGALQRQGERGAEAPDPETWLARELEPAPGLVALPLRSVGKGSKARCAEWDFTAVPCRTLGCVLGAWGEGCKAGTDELVLAERYLQLAPLSYSRLELAFDVPLGEDAQLVLDVQRGARPRLPEHGQAKLILTVEGRQLTAVDTPKSNVGQVTWQLQVPAGRPARMSLRLSEDSDTTLRVLHARVVTALAGESGSGQQPVVR